MLHCVFVIKKKYRSLRKRKDKRNISKYDEKFFYVIIFQFVILSSIIYSSCYTHYSIMHDINEKIIYLKYIVLFSFFFDFWVLLYRSFCLGARIYLSICLSINLFIWNSRSPLVFFFRRHSSHRLSHCRRTITSNRRCTLEWCSVITI
jgi:hypothetical protein